MTRIPMTEAQLQETVLEMAQVYKWLVTHFRPARMKDGSYRTPLQGDAGYPDLTLARNGQIMVRELKTAGGHVAGKQNRWLTELGDHGGIWTPAELSDGTILRELQDGPRADPKK